MRLFDQALEALNNRRFKEAETLFRNIISNDARNFDALHMLGIVCTENGKPSEAEDFFLMALSIDPRFPPLFHNYGLFLAKLKRHQESIDQFNKALTLNDKYAPVYSDRGIGLMELGRLEESLASHNMAAALAPNAPTVFYNRANTFFKQKNYDFARVDYDRALALHPNYANAYCGRGNVCLELKRYDDALAAYDKALVLKPDLATAWLGRGNVFGQLKRYDDTLAACDKALALQPDLANAWLVRGNVFGQLKRYDEAFAAYDKALALGPDLENAWLGRGNAYLELKRYGDALIAYDKALALGPDLENAWLGRGNAFLELQRYGDAIAAYDKALALNTGLVSAEGARFFAKKSVCDWTDYSTECDHLAASVSANRANTNPWAFIAISPSPEDQLQCAKLWAAEKFPSSRNPTWRGERYRHDRIRVAYVSADFHQHATSYLMAGMFECHDTSRFEITAISIGPDDDSEMRRRLKHSFEHFVDHSKQSDDDIASYIKGAEIDILIDLKGFTQDARTNIFARRPAPVQVSYIGYPGTMGASYIDYIIADRTTIPDESRRFYSEKIVVMPNSYQVNDSKRVVCDIAVDRLKAGLPSTGFVFCCFNNNYKIEPNVFSCWMRILARLEGSVLWLLEDNRPAAENLKKEAVARGISADRLIFAKRVPLPEHLARHQLADLFLDALPCNAHTTASDALGTGLPMLTCLGETFAGRVGASLLKAIGLPELITTTLESYERMAIDLASDPQKLAVIRRELERNRSTTPLFNTSLYAKHIETAYDAMYERYQAGLSPDHIVVGN